MDVVTQIGSYAGAAAFLGLALVIPLYFSQARDIQRLRRWRAITPDISEAARQAAAAPLTADHPEQPEAERRPRQPAPPVPPASERVRPRPVPGMGAEAVPPPPPAARPVTGSTPAQPLSPAERIALDRPATARITAERPAVSAAPAGRIRRQIRMPTTGALAGIVAAVAALGVVVVLVVLQTGGGEVGQRQERDKPPAVMPAEVDVAVLNGTAVPDLAARVGDDVDSNGFVLGRVTNSDSPFEKTVVMFEPGSEDEGQAVAQALGLARVQPMAADVRALVEGAQVAVIAGEDRAQQ